MTGGKATLWEGGVRGVGFVHAGNPSFLGMQATQGTIVHGLMHVSDWLPTLCDPVLADCDMSGGKKLDGVSAWNIIARNGESGRSEIVHDLNSVMGVAYRFQDFKLKSKSTGNGYDLFNVVADVGETVNLFGNGSYAGIQATMLARVAFWLNESASVIDQNTLPADPRSNPTLHGNAWLPWLPDNCSDTDCPPPKPPSPAPAPPATP